MAQVLQQAKLRCDKKKQKTGRVPTIHGWVARLVRVQRDECGLAIGVCAGTFQPKAAWGFPRERSNFCFQVKKVKKTKGSAPRKRPTTWSELLISWCLWYKFVLTASDYGSAYAQLLLIQKRSRDRAPRRWGTDSMDLVRMMGTHGARRIWYYYTYIYIYKLDGRL